MSACSSGICPVCNGSLTENGRPCRNCGGQMMLGVPSGRVTLRQDGSPCVHSYKVIRHSSTLETYQCEYCPFSYVIDSGD